MRDEYRKQMKNYSHRNRDPFALFSYANNCVMHYHDYRMSREMNVTDSHRATTLI